MPAIVNLLFQSVSADTTISFSLVLPLFSVLALLAGGGGHLLVWLVLTRQPGRRWARPSVVLLLSLSVADVGALLSLPAVLLGAGASGWRLGGGTCVFVAFSTSLTAGAGVFSLAALALLRQRIVITRCAPSRPSPRHPPTHPCPASPAPSSRGCGRLTPPRLVGVVSVIWLVAVCMALPKVTYVQFDSDCTWAVGRGRWLGFLVPALLVYYLAPLLTIALTCARIVAHLQRAGGRAGGGARGGLGACVAARRNRKATALLIGSTLAFALSWLPYYVLEFVNLPPPDWATAPFPDDSAPPSPSSPPPPTILYYSHLVSTLPDPPSVNNHSSVPPYLATSRYPPYLTTPGAPKNYPTATPPSTLPSPSNAPPSPSPPPPQVSLLWEVGSLTAILLILLAPCWNPPLYFLLSRPAVKQLRALVPSCWCPPRVAPVTHPTHIAPPAQHSPAE